MRSSVSIILFFLLSGFFLAALLGALQRSRRLLGIAGACLVVLACIIVFVKPIQLPSLRTLRYGSTTTTTVRSPALASPGTATPGTSSTTATTAAVPTTTTPSSTMTPSSVTTTTAAPVTTPTASTTAHTPTTAGSASTTPVTLPTAATTRTTVMQPEDWASGPASAAPSVTAPVDTGGSR